MNKSGGSAQTLVFSTLEALPLESHFSGTPAITQAASLEIACAVSPPAKMEVCMRSMILEGKSPNFHLRCFLQDINFPHKVPHDFREFLRDSFTVLKMRKRISCAVFE